MLIQKAKQLQFVCRKNKLGRYTIPKIKIIKKPSSERFREGFFFGGNVELGRFYALNHSFS